MCFPENFGKFRKPAFVQESTIFTYLSSILDFVGWWNATFHKTESTANRSSYKKCSIRKGVPKNFEKFTGKLMCLRPATLLKKRLCHRCLPVNFEKLLIKLILKNICQLQLLWKRFHGSFPKPSEQLQRRN